jgi:hypothetical protein
MTDESEDQTRAVMKAVAQEYHAEATDTDREAIIEKHRAFQQSLEYCDIRIPYAGELAEKMPASKIEARRVISQVLATIEAVALLHQFQRDRDYQGRLIATREDYTVARRLLLGPLQAAIGLGDKVRHLEQFREKLPDGVFSSDEAMKAGGFNNKMTRDRALKELATMGIIENVAKGKSHCPAQWRWTDKSLDDLVLPAVSALFVTS